VVNARAALLSNHEVLTLLRELESDHLARAKTALRVKKEEEAAGLPPRLSGDTVFGEASENLRTVEVEAIQYLSADYLPTTRQSPEGITKLVKDLAPYELTKAEKLQVVNLAPTMPVELYVIVEELEDRLGDSMEEILTFVESSLAAPAPPTIAATELSSLAQHYDESSNLLLEDSLNYPEPHEMYQEEIIFDDTGEGAGVEGDLDMEED
ncbi:DNA-directed RNA polymerase III subunit RPC9, partial [Termitomyces sp. J132]